MDKNTYEHKSQKTSIFYIAHLGLGDNQPQQKLENNQIMKQQEAKAKSKFGNLKKKGPLKNRSYFDSADHFSGQKTGKVQAKDLKTQQLQGVDEESTNTKK